MGAEKLFSNRTVTFIASVFSTVCVLTCVISLPMFYNYMQKVRTIMLSEVEVCKAQSQDIWKQMLTLEISGTSRFARETETEEVNNGDESSQSSESVSLKQRVPLKIPLQQRTRVFIEPEPMNPTLGACCTCQQGPPGNPGRAGRNGLNGHKGVRGKNGEPGRDGRILAPPHPHRKCPPGPTGPPGLSGPKGKRGFAGDPGIPGKAGVPGRQGPVGSEGPRGQPGNPGTKGVKGDPGKVLNGAPPGPPGVPGKPGARGAPGPKGFDGKPGPRGPPGDPGHQGDRGSDGVPGLPGPPGPPGPVGPPGSCNHCGGHHSRSARRPSPRSGYGPNRGFDPNFPPQRPLDWAELKDAPTE